MSESRDLLFELGTEELPPKSLLRLARSLQSEVESGLAKAGLGHAGTQLFATPRRLALLIHALEVAQPDQDVERRGPAQSAAFTEDGQPSKALAGFLRSCGATVEQLITLETDKGAWVAYRQRVQGRRTAELMPAILQQALAALPIAKRMRWGEGSAEFVRPVHWAVLLFGDEVIETELLGVVAGRTTRGHRFHGQSLIQLRRPADYVDQLWQEGRVIADFEQRRERIRTLALEAAAGGGGEAHIEPELLDEVTALVEWPVPVLGSFEARFLELPAEVLITTMQANQKYFPVRSQTGGLLSHFITFSNLESSRPETVREGNERVVRPRLADAEFFWNQDRKRTLESRVDDLAQITFQKTLGSVRAKVDRVQALAVEMAARLDFDSAGVARAALLAKADLLTQMVGEFPELQGTMGRYYALAEGEPLEIAQAIEEQYLPRVSGGPLPETRPGLILALAEKLDTLTGIFSAGLIPSGDKDPYALRRAALGSIRILIESGLDLNLPKLLRFALGRYDHEFDAESVCVAVLGFLHERLRGYSLERGYQHDEFEAVLAVQPASLVDFERRLRAVREFRQLPEAESLAAANKRIRNILKKSGDEIVANVDEAILTDEAEKRLLEAARAARETVLPDLQRGDYTRALCHLAGLRETVDAFFDQVMVMTEDAPLRRNRLGLLAIVEGLFLDIADISRLQG